MEFYLLRMIASDLPVNAESPAVSPPISPVTAIKIYGESFLSTNNEILCASMCSLAVLIVKASTIHKIKIPAKADAKEPIRVCGISTPIKKPAIATDHQGKNRPNEKAIAAVSIVETMYFIEGRFNF
jgi:hypothetical protein